MLSCSHRFVVGTAFVATTLFASSPAIAWVNVYSPGYDARAYASNSNTKFNVADLSPDGRWVYGYWNKEDSDHRLNNKSGSGTTVWKTVGGVAKGKVCEEVSWSPDSCSGWDS